MSKALFASGVVKSLPHPRVTMYQRDEEWVREYQTFLALDGRIKHPLIYILGGRFSPPRAFEYVYPPTGPGIKKLSEELFLHDAEGSHEEAVEVYVEYASRLPAGYQTQHQGGTGDVPKGRGASEGGRQDPASQGGDSDGAAAP